MATDDNLKVFYPETIADQPFPGEAGMVGIDTPTATGGQVITAEKIKDKPFPQKRIAKELISNSLNTISRKILAVYQFTKMGAIQIGEYILGKSGEIKISPDGIVAKNKNGYTTFALDGDTGDAVFKGEIRASDFVVVDNNGLVSLSNFSSNNVYIAEVDPETSTTLVDVPSATLTMNLIKTTNVLIMFSANVTVENGAVSTGRVIIILYVDGAIQNEAIQVFNGNGVSTDVFGGGNSFQSIKTLSAGDHTISLKWKVLNAGNVGRMYDLSLSYLTLGR